MQSVIIYRNPMEAAMWELLMSGSFFPIIVGIIVFFAVFLTVNAVIIERYFRRSKYATNIALAFSVLCAGVTVWYMWL